MERERDLALAVAAEVSELAHELWAGGKAALQPSDKADGSPVTAADTAVERVILEALRASFPGDALLAEETAGRVDANARRCWMIDPIDGTLDFIEGDVNFAIHIGLCIDGRPTLGVVVEPAHHRTSWGIVGVGAWQIEGGSTKELRCNPSTQLRFVGSKSHRTTRLDAVALALGVAESERRRMSSVGCKVSALVRGEAEVYAHDSLGTKSWDSCAPQALLEAAGGSMTDMTGRPLEYGRHIDNTRGLLATAGLDHADTVRRLAGVTAGWYDS